MKSIISHLLGIVAFLLAQNALAESSTATVDSTEGANSSRQKVGHLKKFEDSNTLTDPRLRADEGSMSQLSAKFNLSYYGPTLADLNAKDQPNPDGGVGMYETSLSGSISARLRLSATRSWALGTGIKAIHPLHGLERFDVNNPYLAYEMSNRWGQLQMRNSPGISLITVPNFKKIGEYGALTFYNAFVYEFSGTSLSLGLDTDFGYYLYHRAYEKSDGKASRFTFAVSPNLKYRLNEKININTAIATNFWNPRSLENAWALHNRSPTGKIGLGYSWTKEIYLNPYIYLYPNKLATDTATLNFAAVFSVL